MKRMIAMVIIAGLAVACSDHDKGSVMDRTANAAQKMSDSAVAVGSAALDSAKHTGETLVDSAKSKAGSMVDSAKAMALTTKESVQAAGQRVLDKTKTTASAGALALSRSRTKLTKDQVQQLQTALTNDGCDAGTADGVMGTKTRSAIACSMKKHGIARDDVKDLYQALGLNF